MTRYITMSRLGGHGRFANSLFQYAFLHVYAKQHNLTVQNAAWVGEQLFNIPPAPITTKLTNYYEPLKPTGQPEGPPDDNAIDHDVHGYFQYHMSYYRPYREFVQGLFRPRENVLDRMAPAVQRFDALGKTRVGVHLRRGDYGQLMFYLTPVQWYLDWLKEYWPTLDNPVLFVASEDRALVDEFADYNPQTAESLGIDLQAKPLPTYDYLKHDLQNPQPHLLDFFPDWFLLTQCEYVLMPNSTFSFTAAMLSKRLRHCWRSNLPTQRFEEIDVWDTVPMTQDMAEDYKHIPGVCLEKNPHW